MLHYRRILFPVDFSLRCRQMAPMVADVAKKFFSEVVVLHALDPLPVVCYAPEFTYFAPKEFIEKQRETMSGELAAFAASNFADLPAKCLIVTGDPADCISAQAAKNNIDLIMMPTHGRGVFRRLLLGSVTAKVLHDCPLPVWTAAHCERFPVTGHEIRRILCALDTGRENVRVLEVAADLAHEYDADVHLIHALPGQEAYHENTIDPGLRQFLMREAREKIEALQQEVGTHWDLCVKLGGVEDCVRRMAEDYGANVVLIGRGRGRERFEARRTHSTGIIRESPCPVLSV
jgi:nucleotide-binding universal stress UspA family protein